MAEKNSHTEEQVNKYDLSLLEKTLCSRLDGHGKGIDNVEQELKEMRKEQGSLMRSILELSEKMTLKIAATEKDILAQIAAVKDLCSERHTKLYGKVSAITASISAIFLAIDIVAHKLLK